MLALPGEPTTASPAGEASGLDLGERVGCSSSPGPSFCVLTIIKPNEITKDEVKQTLSTMVLVPRSDGEPAAGEPTVDATEQTVTDTVATILPGEMDPDVWEGAEDYYRAAGLEDWGYTCDHLDAETQSLFTRDEWLQKNQWFADNGSVTYHIESMERLGTSSGLAAGVSLRLTYEDGSSSPRSTYFVYEVRASGPGTPRP